MSLSRMGTKSVSFIFYFSLNCLLRVSCSAAADSTHVNISMSNTTDIAHGGGSLFSSLDLKWIPNIDTYSTAVRVDSSARKSESTTCLRDLLFVVEQLKVKAGDPVPDWFLQMLDSAGKVPSGILTGALSWPGYFRQCLEVESKGQRHFSGRYCSVYWSVTMNNASLVAPLTQGLCVPDSCDSSDMKNHMHILTDILLKVPRIRTLAKNKIKFQGVYCHPRPEERKLDIAAAITITVLILIILIAISATVADLILRRRRFNPFHPRANSASSGEDEIFTSNEDDGIVLTSTSSGSSEPTGRAGLIRRFVTCFSLYANIAKLFATDQVCNREIASLNGIRVLSLTWVMLCHSYLFSLSVTNNLMHLLKDSDSLPYFVIINGSFCVDSFFVLGGLLLSYHYFSPPSLEISNEEDASKVRHHPLVQFLVIAFRRIYRLLPAYLVVLAFDANLTHYGSSGPFWDYGDQVTSEKVLCSNSGWYNILFINNFLPLKDQCMAWTWYLANDMQLFLFSFILLLLIKRNRKFGIGLVVFFIVTGAAATWIVSFTYQLETGFAALVRHPDPNSIMKYVDSIYTKPYARAGPYFIGLLTGILLAEERHRRISSRKKILGVVLGSLLLILVLFGNYHAQPNTISDAFYNSLSRISWALLVCLLIILTAGSRSHASRKITPIHACLTFPLFVPLSKLTYCAFLIHPLVINFYYRTLQQPLLFNSIGIFSIYLSNIFLVYLASIPVYLLFEAPFSRLFKKL